jgi:hypothetical protein
MAYGLLVAAEECGPVETLRIMSDVLQNAILCPLMSSLSYILVPLPVSTSIDACAR